MHRTVDVLAAAPHREHQHVAARVKPGFGEPTGYPPLVLAGLEPRKKKHCDFPWNTGCEIVITMGTHVSFIFSGYNPYFKWLKPSFFMVLGSKGNL